MVLKNAEELAAVYKETKNDKKRNAIVMEIFTTLYFNLEKFGILFVDEDLRNDFLVRFYHKIPRTLETYNPVKSRFLTYLIQNLKFAFISFKYETKTAETANKILEAEETQQFYCKEEESRAQDYNLYTGDISVLYGSDAQDTINCKKMKPEHKTIFLLACKSCLFLTDDMILAVSKRLGISYAAFSKLIGDIRIGCYSRCKNINEQIYKRNKYYMRMRLCKKILESSDKTTGSYRKYEKAYRYYLLSWKRAICVNKKQIKAPSNRLIGKYINISRGTIDKNIAKALKKWYSQSDENIFGFG